MNPYPRPNSGSYKTPLIEGLKALSLEKEAQMVENGQIKFAINSTITGNVKRLSIKVFIEALRQTNYDVNNYYIHALVNGDVIPALSEGAFTYDENDAKAVAYVKDQVTKSDNEIINPYFQS
jgi:hypothetical protein